MSNNSNVYSCLLDVSKDFDKVHYGKLFHILLNQKVPFCIIQLLMDSFERQRVRVIWNSHVSDYFPISNGVKQGRVISPVMFNLYSDNLLISLKHVWYRLSYKWNVCRCSRIRRRYYIDMSQFT